MRQRLVEGRWVKGATAEGEPLDTLLEENVTAYNRYVEARLSALKQTGPLLPRIEPASLNGQNGSVPISQFQMAFWPPTHISA
jgi:hypothetical protein